MKKMFFALIIGAALSQTASAQDSKNETLEGNGNLVTREVSISPFSKLKASGVYELKLSQGDKESLLIEADENLQALFIVKNEGNQLVIEMKKLKNVNLKAKTKLRIHLTFKNITDLELSTVGNVRSDEQLTFNNLELDSKSVGNVDLKLTANEINVNNSSVGNITLSGKAQTATMINNGVGNLDAGDFVVQTMNIDNSGVGNAYVNAEKELKVKDSFLGKVKNKGAAPMKKKKQVVI
jgi:hypothetical protein